jgi:hypothetical protein
MAMIQRRRRRRRQPRLCHTDEDEDEDEDEDGDEAWTGERGGLIKPGGSAAPESDDEEGAALCRLEAAASAGGGGGRGGGGEPAALALRSTDRNARSAERGWRLAVLGRQAARCWAPRCLSPRPSAAGWLCSTGGAAVAQRVRGEIMGGSENMET